MSVELKVATPSQPSTDPAPRRALPRPSPHRPTFPPSRGRALLEEHFDLVQKRLQKLSHRGGLPEAEADEFRSWALFKLVENDYHILGSWEGRSSFSTYLTIVLSNLLRDYRNHLWGKWRPSAAALRLGREAVLLERLRFREHLSWNEAIDRVRIELGTSTSHEELERTARALPERIERRLVGEQELLRMAVDGGVEERLEQREAAAPVHRLREKLSALLQALPAEDHLLLTLHFRDDVPLASIASILRLPLKAIYSRRDRCLKRLRRELEHDASIAAEFHELLDSGDSFFSL